MTDEQVLYRRALRRGVHASRTPAAAVVAALFSVLLLGVVVAAIWWLVDPDFRDRLTATTESALASLQPGTAAMLLGGLLVLVAVVLLVLAVSPGRRARRARTGDRLALLVDDGVVADAIADAVARRLGIARRHIAVTLARRGATIRVTPISGTAVDQGAVASASDDTLSRIGLDARSRVIIASEGVIA